MKSTNYPLELIDPLSYGYLDEAQRQIIFEHDALDLVLIENANETFRQFMMDGNNNNIERIMEKIRCENENSVFLRSDTIDINEDDGIWSIDESKSNSKTMKKYIQDAIRKMKKNKINSSTIIYTIFGLNLGEGGHYGALICDLKRNAIRVFDSMSGLYSDRAYILESGTQACFIQLGNDIFNDPGILTLLREKTGKKYKFSCKAVKNSCMLQPTGGFEELISPDLEKIADEDLKMKINIQHTDSQNHFCYIWSILFIQIYLRGKLKLFKTFMDDIRSKEIIPLTVVKQYILGLLNILNNGDLEHVLFFYKHFPRLWSNHESPLDMDFKLYGFNFKSARTMYTCLDHVLKMNIKLRVLKKSYDRKAKDEIEYIIAEGDTDVE